MKSPDIKKISKIISNQSHVPKGFPMGGPFSADQAEFL